MLRGKDNKVFHKPMACLEMGEEGGKGGSDGEDEVEGGRDARGAVEELEFQSYKRACGLGGWRRWQRLTGRRGYR